MPFKYVNGRLVADASTEDGNRYDATGQLDKAATASSGFQSLMDQAPQQHATNYDSGAVSGFLANYLNQVKSLTPKATNFNFSPVSWQGVNAERVDAAKESKKALDYNLSNMGVYTDMAARLTSADTTARLNQLDTINPGWRDERDQAGAVNESWMRGEVSKDVQDVIGRTAAFQSVMSGGYGNGSNTRALSARDLGMTSVDLQMKGQENSRQWQSLMGQLLPQVTSSAAVMESQGLSSKDAINTALQNASNKLAASTANSQGMLNASTSNSELSLKAQQLGSNERLGIAGLQNDAAKNYADWSTTNVQNKYQSDVNNSNVLFGNLNRPWQMQAQYLGQQSGQNQSYGYGI